MKLSREQSEWVREQVLQLGFLESALLPLQVDPNYSTYDTWMSEGHHEPLTYLGKNNNIRKDPKSIGQNLHSAFVFLHPYPKEFESRWVARYAWGKDYHHTMKAKLFQLAELFEQEFGPLKEHRVCVDTAPILERSLAEQSGLGWIAKNGCLLSRQHGSFFMIGVWMLSHTTDHVPNKASFHCGTCTRCMEACPTGAFLSPGLLEAKLCLSTQTIENRKAIDPSFYPHIHHQAFGCDICQEVCPWNRKTLYHPKQEHLPSLDQLLTLDETEFRKFFRKTALERPGWIGLRRNFLIAAANQEGIPKHIFELHLNHPNDIIRETAQHILDQRNA